MELKDYISLINGVGFPIFVALFLLFKMDKSIQTLERTISGAVSELKDALVAMLRNKP